jgi:glyoxylase-like metal-dependent hydrolase (beta-lactamase superfamily II)
MIFKQFYLNCLAHASYLVGDEETGIAAVVDPQRDVDGYLSFAREHGLTIAHVFLTHFHADFLAGHLELRDRTGATIYLGASAKAEYRFRPLGDGDRVEFGKVRLVALETPGHTPESISLLVYDLAADPHVPWAVLTGDTLFIGDVGRPDLRAALGWAAADLGKLLYTSLHDKLLRLPDSSRVYPAHGAGSLCGKAISKETTSTIGEQRRSNYALQPMSREAFLDLVTADQPDAPPYFTYDAVLNSRERPTLDQALARELRPLTIDEVLAQQARGAQVLDTRDPAEFAAAHLQGSINVGLVGEYATWAGTVLTRDRPIVIVADPGAETESAMRLGRIGFDHVVGYLAGGLRSADGSAARIVSTERVAADVAAERLASPAPPLLLDVRSRSERQQKWIEGSVHIPLSRLLDHLAGIGPDRPVLVHCAGGYRSSIAASLLQGDGRTNVSELAGGITAWEAGGHQVTRHKAQDPSHKEELL